MLLPNVTGYLKPWSKFIKFLSTDIWVKVPNTGDDQIHTLKGHRTESMGKGPSVRFG
jgi:hypothetical protein